MDIKIKVQSGLCCPVCGAPEVKDENTVNIRAFKVNDKYGWWSECLCDHGIMDINGKDVKVGRIWFKLADELHPCLIEVEGQPLLTWESES